MAEYTCVNKDGKTIDDLLIQKLQLQLELDSLNSERSKINKLLHISNSQIRTKNKEIEDVTLQIDKLTSLVNMHNIVNFISNDDNKYLIDILSKEELTIITNKMDKTDYTKYGCCRFIDLEKLIVKIVEIKKSYPNWTLIDMRKCGQLDVLPPKSFYNLYFTPFYISNADFIIRLKCKHYI